MYHWYDNGDVPPDVADVRVTGWPLSIVGDDGVMEVTSRSALYPNALYTELTVVGLESVITTFALNVLDE